MVFPDVVTHGGVRSGAGVQFRSCRGDEGGVAGMLREGVAFFCAWGVPGLIVARSALRGASEGTVVCLVPKLWALAWIAALIRLTAHVVNGVSGELCQRQDLAVIGFVISYCLIHGTSFYWFRRNDVAYRLNHWIRRWSVYPKVEVLDRVGGAIVEGVAMLGLLAFFFGELGSPLLSAARTALSTFGREVLIFFGFVGPDAFQLDELINAIKGDVALSPGQVQEYCSGTIHFPQGWILIVLPVLFVAGAFVVMVSFEPALNASRLWSFFVDDRFRASGGCARCRGVGAYVHKVYAFGALCDICRGSGWAREPSTRPVTLGLLWNSFHRGLFLLVIVLVISLIPLHILGVE